VTAISPIGREVTGHSALSRDASARADLSPIIDPHLSTKGRAPLYLCSSREPDLRAEHGPLAHGGVMGDLYEVVELGARLDPSDPEGRAVHAAQRPHAHPSADLDPPEVGDEALMVEPKATPANDRAWSNDRARCDRAAREEARPHPKLSACLDARSFTHISIGLHSRPLSEARARLNDNKGPH
jgi:hypothetical protein